MSLTVKHLNADASFLLTFQPILPFPPSPGQPNRTFTILLDPWITGSSKIWHPKFSISRQKAPPCVSSLRDLPEPDLVVISQDKSDHCHEQTLTQLPAEGGKTLILAEPAAARAIRGWKYFDQSKVVTLPRWDDSHSSKTPSSPTSSIYRVPVPPLTPHGSPGEVTIAYLPQKLDITGLHSAIGITYRPPTTHHPLDDLLPPTPPSSPRSFHSTFSPTITDRTLSVIFSPHGCTYKTLAPYVTSHLVAEAALPLTALLHCFDMVTNAWYLGGNICAGFPGGWEIARSLAARTWISAHDGDKETTGFASAKIVVRKYGREEVEAVVSPRSAGFPSSKRGRTETEAVVLGVGEEIRLTRVMDLWEEEPQQGSEREKERFVNMDAVWFEGGLEI